jgi:hypothetical protein
MVRGSIAVYCCGTLAAIASSGCFQFIISPIATATGGAASAGVSPPGAAPAATAGAAPAVSPAPSPSPSPSPPPAAEAEAEPPPAPLVAPPEASLASTAPGAGKLNGLGYLSESAVVGGSLALSVGMALLTVAAARGGASHGLVQPAWLVTGGGAAAMLGGAALAAGPGSDVADADHNSAPVFLPMATGLALGAGGALYTGVGFLVDAAIGAGSHHDLVAPGWTLIAANFPAQIVLTSLTASIAGSRGEARKANQGTGANPLNSPNIRVGQGPGQFGESLALDW